MTKKKVLTFVGALVLLVLAQMMSGKISDTKSLLVLLTQVLQLPIASPGTEDAVPVTAVVDGDTIKVDLNGKIETVRLIGIDTPEVVDPRKPVQCFGREASAKAKELLTGENVKLVSDPTQSERDKYGRLLRYVFLEDGTSFNKLMIEQGYAHEYTYDSNPYQYQIEFQAAERAAREGERGLWSSATCNGITV